MVAVGHGGRRQDRTVRSVSDTRCCYGLLVQGPMEHGVPGLVNLFGIESPGLTSSLAIADMVAQLLDGTAPAAKL